MPIEHIDDLDYCSSTVLEIAEGSDDLSALDCIAAIGKLEELAGRIRNTKSLLESRLINTMEQPIQTGGKVWIVTDDATDIWDHEFVGKRVAERLAVDEDGVYRTDVRQVAHDVANQMQKLYVSNSTKVKVTAARAFDKEVAKAKRRRLKGKKVITMDVEEHDDEG